MQLIISIKKTMVLVSCFNTASGKHCCNLMAGSVAKAIKAKVSIPQVVSTVATEKVKEYGTVLGVSIPQAVSTVATYYTEIL